jgi:hypothetical protein
MITEITVTCVVDLILSNYPGDDGGERGIEIRVWSLFGNNEII